MEKNVQQEAERKKASSALALQTSSEEGPPRCAFCQKCHTSEQYWQIYTFGDGKSKNTREQNVYDVNLIDTQGNNLSILAVEIISICPPLRHQKVPDDIFQSFSHLKLAGDYGHDHDLTLDILIVVDYCWRFIKVDTIVRFEDLVAHESVFGYILSGSCMRAHEESISHQLLCINIANNVNDSDLLKFWSSKSVGINVEKDNPPKDPVLDIFESTNEYVNGRYDVALPWKDEGAKLSLLNNENNVRMRLAVLNHKFEKNPDLKKEYDKVLMSYEQDSIIVEVPFSELGSSYPTYYMPHRPVIKDSISPKFRRWNIALTADIVKAFWQVGVQCLDQDVHRFLWQCGNIVLVTRFVGVPFGNSSSPFLLNAAIEHHLDSYNNSVTVQELKENLYVDDWLSGVDTVEEASRMFSEAQSILLDAGMTLSKWHTNNDSLINQHYQYFEPEVEDVTKLLEMYWNSSEDVFSFEGLNLGNNFEFNCTKRKLLSLIARLFDPLGFISSFTMYAKVWFQEIWRLGLGWDEILPHNAQLKFQEWINSVEVVKNFEVNKCYFPGLSLNSVQGLEVHAFSDASEKGYGICVYLCIPKSDENFQVSFVFAITTVAPIGWSYLEPY
ncbi:uncharacterized protein [Macrobrachium rosenbergii]|uniref:uncharacterized protein n=1 Tax=Macrobrachium rosenbergii TaxID=79674 RepID=UPI0034D48EB7